MDSTPLAAPTYGDPNTDPHALLTFDQWWQKLSEEIRTAEGWWSKLTGELSPAGLPLNSTSLAYENSRVVKSGAGTCFGLSGYNSGPTQWVQVFDANAIPQNGAIPVAIEKAVTATNFSIDWGVFGSRWGRAFSRGIIVCNSSTGPTLTIASADCWFDVQYV